MVPQKRLQRFGPGLQGTRLARRTREGQIAKKSLGGSQEIGALKSVHRSDFWPVLE
jgi:hypothetical protein